MSIKLILLLGLFCYTPETTSTNLLANLLQHKNLIQFIFQTSRSLILITNSTKDSGDPFRVMNEIFESDTKNFVVYSINYRNLHLEFLMNLQNNSECGKSYRTILLNLQKMPKVNDLWNLYLYSGFIVQSNLAYLKEQMWSLPSPLQEPVLFLIEETLGREELYSLFSVLWIKRGILMLAIFTNGKIYSYNPFETDGNSSSYGVLKDSSFLVKIPTDFNKAPVRVEIFDSVYSQRAINNKTNETSYFGPDIETSKLLANSLNYTSK